MSKPKTSKTKLNPTAITGIGVGAIVAIAGIVAVINANRPQEGTGDSGTPDQSQTDVAGQPETPASYSGVEIGDGERTSDAAILTLAKLISDYHTKWENGATPEGSFNKTGSFGEYLIQKYIFEGMESEGYKIKYCDHGYTPSYPLFWSSTIGRIDSKTSVCLFDWNEYEEDGNNADYYGIKLLLNDDENKVTISSVNFHGSDD